MCHNASNTYWKFKNTKYIEYAINLWVPVLFSSFLFEVQNCNVVSELHLPATPISFYSVIFCFDLFIAHLPLSFVISPCRMCISPKYPSWQMVLYILPKYVPEGEICWAQCQCCCSWKSNWFWSNKADNKPLHPYC